MKHFIHTVLILAVSTLCGCSEETLKNIVNPEEFDEGEVAECRLGITVKDFVVNASSKTRIASDWKLTEEEEKKASDEEKKIDNLWVFQYDGNGELLIKPRYYEISDQTELKNLPIILKPNVSSTIYVVTNTNSNTWAAESGSSTYNEWNEKFNTLDSLKLQQLPNVFPKSADEHYNGDTDEKTILLPMEGYKENVKANLENVVKIEVARMYAKLKVKVLTAGDVNEDNYNFNSSNMQVGNIPGVLQVQTRYTENSTEAANYPTDQNSWISRAFSFEKEHEYVFYVPENIQGIHEGATAGKDKEDYATKQALKLTLNIQDKQQISHTFNFYPGGDNLSDFNIKRNNVYRTVLHAQNGEAKPVPSANCLVVAPNSELAFYPYIRNEKGGGYDFRQYLDYANEEKCIKGVKIIWQTKDCIGDNSNGDLVTFDSNAGVKTKIHVKAGIKGNALIGAWNNEECKGDVLWSWHIWVTDLDPDNVANAITYKRYAWDKNEINTNELVDGYGGVMKCNLGAMALVNDNKCPATNDSHKDKGTQAFGMFYQWGRKDPFPPYRKPNGSGQLYTTANTDTHYANDNNTVVEKTSGEVTSQNELFYSVMGKAISDNNKQGVEYSIAHPTVFIAGVDLDTEENGLRNKNAFNDGDWLPKGQSDDKLWGGLVPKTDGSMTYYTVNEKEKVHIFDNYGSEKSIFDPCPKGWRVAPGDLWLRFTDTGKNPESLNHINYDVKDKNYYGMMMYLQGWREGEKSFFPTPGTREANGKGMRQFTCGNYHNATTDTNNRVNILHIHNDNTLFNVFEDKYWMYHIKSVAGPIRCIRCTSDDYELPDYAK